MPSFHSDEEGFQRLLVEMVRETDGNTTDSMEVSISGSTPSLLLSESQYLALFFIAIIVSTGSLIGSSAIIYSIRYKRQHDDQQTLNQILICMSVCDILGAIYYIFEQSLTMSQGESIWKAGTALCTFSGLWLLNAAFCSVLYNVCLSMYFSWTIRGIVTPRQFQTTKVGKYGFHVLSILFPICVTSLAVPFQSINPHVASSGCEIAAYPKGCVDMDELDGVKIEDDSLIPCARGSPTFLLWYCVVFFYPTAVMVFVGQFYFQFKIVRHVHSIERHTVARSMFSQNELRKTKLVARQSLLFVVSAMATSLTAVYASTITLEGSKSSTMAKLVVLNMVLPAQGMFNYCIFKHPEYAREWQRRRERDLKQNQRTQHPQTNNLSSDPGEDPTSESNDPV